MSAQKLLDQILPILNTVKDDEIKLQKILSFLENEIYEEPEEIDSFQDEDDKKIDPESMPVSETCMNCKIHWIDNQEENLICRIKRFDNRNNKDFKCDAFEKL